MQAGSAEKVINLVSEETCFFVFATSIQISEANALNVTVSKASSWSNFFITRSHEPVRPWTFVFLSEQHN